MYIAADPYPWPYDGNLDPSNTALVVIDMQTDFCGVGGYVDNRWTERLGGALLLSLVEDVVKIAAASQGSSGNTGNNNTLVLPNTTAQGSKLAEKVLEATINIPPLLYQNQGGVVGVYVARDIDFSSVYELRPQ